ncbi:MAG: hypothetical protein M3Z04_19985, partial [Chloroflexota bacterium]|nr:hypothetical protein [Chloroflexota bacterium]
RAGIAAGAGAALGGLAVLGGLLLWGGRPATDEAAAVPLDVLHAHSALLLPDSDVALIGHHSGLLRSSDGGRSWTAVAGVTGDVLALTAAPAPSTDLFLAGPGQVRRSRDGGQTWAAVPAPPTAANLTALTAGVDNTLYAQVRDSGLFASRAGGPWTLQGGGLPAESSTLAWYPDPVGALFAGGPGVGVLASGDGGRGWGSAGGVVNGALPTLAVWALAVDAASGDLFTGADGTTVRGALYAATDAGLFKTIDGGTSWTALPLRRPLVAVSARTQPRPLLLAVDSRALVWRSSDHGGSWSAAP